MTPDPTTTAPDPAELAARQPVLPTLELPEYHGIKPIGMRTSVNGTGNRLASPHGIGDRTVLVLEVKCKKAGHEDTDDGLVYHEVHKVVDMFELDRDAGTRLLRFLRSTYRTEADAARGVSPLPDLGDAGYTDDNGIVLLPDEVAERRGDTILRVLGAAELTPVVAMYDNGTRLLWPDEYEPGRDRPRIDEVNEDGARVVELLHHATGEPVDDDGAELPTDPEPFPADDGWETAVRSTLAGAEPVILADEHAADPVFDPTRGTYVEADQTTTTPDSPPPGYRIVEGFLIPDPDGGYDDAAEPYDTGDYEAPPADTPAPAPSAPALPGEHELEQTAPDAFAYAFVDCQIPELRTKLVDVADGILLRRIMNAEKLGRGRKLSPRRGALDAIAARIAEVG